MLEECFNKGIINAKIISGKAKGETKGFSILGKLAILGNIKREHDPFKKDRS
jgi:hypothetical protein